MPEQYKNKIDKINSFLGILEQAFVSSGNFFFFILLSKLLTIEELGIYSLTWIIVISISSFIAAWFSSPMLSIQPKLTISESYAFINDLTKQFIAILLIMFILIFIVFFLFDGILSIEIFFLSIAGVFYYLFEYLRRVAMIKKYYKSLLSASILLYFSLFLGSIFLSNSIFLSIAKITAISYGCISTVFLIFLLPKFIEGKLKNFHSRRLKFSKWMSYTSLLQFVSGNAVSIFSALILPVAEIGLLRLGQSFVSFMNPIIIYLDNNARIYFSSILGKNGKKAFNNAFTKFRSIFLLISSLFSLLLGYTGIHLINIYYPELSDSNLKAYFIFYIFLMIITINTFVYRLKFLVLEKTNYIYKTYLFGATAATIVFYPLTFALNGFGVIATLILTQFTMLFFLININRKLIQGQR